MNNKKVPILMAKELSGNGGISDPQKEGDCAYDLSCAEDVVIPPSGHLPIDVPVGVAVKIPEGYFGLIINRSGIPRKIGIGTVPGIIDEGYTGPLYACVYNMTRKKVEIQKGTRIVQMILLPKYAPPILRVEKLPITERGESGFGSSGLK